jgi:hypothetical protein
MLFPGVALNVPDFASRSRFSGPKEPRIITRNILLGIEGSPELVKNVIFLYSISYAYRLMLDLNEVY